MRSISVGSWGRKSPPNTPKNTKIQIIVMEITGTPLNDESTDLISIGEDMLFVFVTF